MPGASKQDISERLSASLERARLTRVAADRPEAWHTLRRRVKAWQAERLAQTHPDLLSHPRYRDAANFFLEELYGPRDLGQRDADVARIIPTLTRMLPASALQAIADAIELDALTESLDAAITDSLHARGGGLDEAGYTEAYRNSSTRAERLRQIQLADEIGHALNSLVHVPLIGAALSMMHGPAKLAGLETLHHFLASGFQAFKKMRDAREFLDTIRTRETAVMESLFATAPPD
jgi:hypothetical protein